MSLQIGAFDIDAERDRVADLRIGLETLRVSDAHLGLRVEDLVDDLDGVRQPHDVQVLEHRAEDRRPCTRQPQPRLAGDTAKNTFALVEPAGRELGEPELEVTYEAARRDLAPVQGDEGANLRHFPHP